MQVIANTSEPSGELAFLKYAIDEHAIVAWTDTKGRITNVNQKFCDISQYSRQELIGQDHRIISSGFHPKSFFVELWRIIASGKTWRGEVCNRAKDGSLYWVDTTIVPIHNDGGPIAGYVAIRADITERKRLQDQHLDEVNAELQRKNDELEQYVYSVSHDLKSPIVTILGFAGLMQKHLAENRTERFNDTILRISRAACRMRAVIDDLLELSRVGRVFGVVEDVELGGVVAQVLEDMQPSIAECGAKVEILGPMPVVRTERMRMWQVFQNLVGNALAYGSSAAEPKIEIGARVEGDTTLVFVRDNGVGIAPEHHERIFGLFQRLERGGRDCREAVRKGGGTGVGLAIVRRVAETHRGRAWVESVPGQGSTFWVSLRGPSPLLISRDGDALKRGVA